MKSILWLKLVAAHADYSNPECFVEVADSDDCCDTRAYGPLGDSRCWFDGRSYDVCCLPPDDGLCDMDAARRRLLELHGISAEDSEISESPGVRYLQLWPELTSEYQDQLRGSCCQHYDSECWDPGEPRIYDMSASYVQCCFPRLRRILSVPPPAWLSDEVDRAVSGIRAVGPDERDAFERECSSRGEEREDNRHLFCRLRASASTDSIWSSCNITRIGHEMLYDGVHGHVETLLRALHILRHLKAEPFDTDLFVSVLDMVLYNFSVPVIAGNSFRESPNVVLVPHEWQLNAVAHRYWFEVPGFDVVPWEDKEPIAYWRGGLSAEYEYWADGLGERPPPPTRCRWDAAGVRLYHRGPHDASNWYQHNRGRLALLSTYSQDVDAKITGLVGLWPHLPEVREEIEGIMSGLGVLGERRPLQDFGRYRYIVVPDASDRAYFLLWLNAVIFMAQSAIKHWGMALLTAWEHYVPLRHDMGDLLEKVQWARDNDDECRRIASRAQALSRHVFSPDYMLAYFFQVAQRLSGNSAPI